MTPAELNRWLHRVERKLDKVTDDHEQRIRRMERAMYVAIGLGTAGATSGIAAIASALSGGP